MDIKKMLKNKSRKDGTFYIDNCECGGVPEIEHDGRIWFALRCPKCGKRTRYFEDLSDSFEAWHNMEFFEEDRTTPTQDDAASTPKIVRCKDCLFSYDDELRGCIDILRCHLLFDSVRDHRIVDPNWFCADGKKRG